MNSDLDHCLDHLEHVHTLLLGHLNNDEVCYALRWLEALQRLIEEAKHDSVYENDDDE